MNAWVKFAIGLFGGGGCGLLTIEYFAYGKPNYWEGKGPPEGLFVGIGIGCLVSALIWFWLFSRKSIGPER